MATAGWREFIQVLRLMEDFHQHQVEQAVSEALRLGAISFDASKLKRCIPRRLGCEGLTGPRVPNTGSARRNHL